MNELVAQLLDRPWDELEALEAAPAGARAGEGLRIAAELRAPALAVHPHRPSEEGRAADLAHPVRLAADLRRVDPVGRTS